MPRIEVSEHWKSILLLSNPRAIELYKTVGYEYNIKVLYSRGVLYDYKYNLNDDMTINVNSIDLYVNGKYYKSMSSLSSNEREQKLLSNFITFLYSCHNRIDEWKENYDVFAYQTYKLLRKMTCNIL